jgi:multidrug efflux system outer membrane protein
MKKARHVVPALLALYLLPACKTVTEQLSPDPAQSIPESKGTFRQAGEDSPPATQALEKPWWELFKDSSLDQLIASLNDSNPDAKAALARVDQSLAVLGITRAKILPTVTGTSLAGSRQDSLNNLLFPIASPNYDRFSIGLNATWELDLWGRVQATAKSDRYLASAEDASYRSLLLSLQANLARQYFAYQANHAQLEYLQKSHDLAQENLKMHQARLDIGEGRQSDVSKALQELQDTASALELAKRNTGKLHHSLAILTGVLPSSFEVPQGPFPLPPAIPAGLPSALLSRRPDLISADNQLRSAAIRVGLGKVDFLPKFTILGNAGYASLSEGNLFEKASEFFDYGPKVDIPIFQYQLRKHAVGQAKARFTEQAAHYQSAFLNAVREVDDALLDLKSYSRELAHQRQTLDSTTLSAKAAKASYDTGLTDYFDYILAEQIRLQSAAREATLTAEQLSASVRLIQALGGNW